MMMTAKTAVSDTILAINLAKCKSVGFCYAMASDA
jgi:hypothetical protein